jgi:hypothetical protein
MLPIAMTAGYACGALIALAARRPLTRAYDPMRTRYCAVAAMFGVAAIGPSAALFYALYPDWSLMYFANPAHLSSAVMIPLLYLFAATSPVIGFLTTFRLSQLKKPRALRLSFAMVWLALFAFFAIGGERLGAVAYYDAFHAGGERVSLARSPLLFAVLVAALAIIAWIVFALIVVRRHVDLSEHLPGDGKEAKGSRFSLTSATAQSIAAAPSDANLPR